MVGELLVSGRIPGEAEWVSAGGRISSFRGWNQCLSWFCEGPETRFFMEQHTIRQCCPHNADDIYGAVGMRAGALGALMLCQGLDSAHCIRGDSFIPRKKLAG